jgi:hypothetical protein
MNEILFSTLQANFDDPAGAQSVEINCALQKAAHRKNFRVFVIKFADVGVRGCRGCSPAIGLKIDGARCQ